MEAIVLAGGLGTRLRHVVPDLPKPMAPVAGRPFLEIVLAFLAGKGFRRVVLSLGHMSEKVVTHFGNRFAGMDLVYEIEMNPLGTGGAIRAALGRCNGDHVFIFNGEAQWCARRAPIIVAREVEDTSRYGRVKVADGRVCGFTEKGAGGAGLINAGCYVFQREILDHFQLDMPFSIESEFLAHAVAHQRFEVFVTNGHFIDIGVPEDYVRAQTELARWCK